MKKNTSKIVGSRIRSFRKERNMSIQQLSKLLGISQQHHSRHELGDMRIHVDTLYSIAEILDIDIIELICDGTEQEDSFNYVCKADRSRHFQAESLISPDQDFSLFK